MKNRLALNSLFGVLLSFTLFLASCNNDVEMPAEVNAQFTSPITIEGGILHFSSIASFAETCDNISDMNEDEFRQWENSLSFKSLRSEINFALDQLEECNDSLLFQNLLTINSDLFEVEDSTIVPIVESISYASITNREGFFYIGETLHKVKGGKLIVSLSRNVENINEALSDGSLKSAGCDRSNDFIIIDYCQPIEPVLKSGTESVGEAAEITRNDRRVKLNLTATNVIGFIMVRNMVTMLVDRVDVSERSEFTAKVSNYKKSWGKYRSYKTTCEMRDVEFVVDGYSGGFTSRRSNGEVNSLTSVWTLYSRTRSYSYAEFLNFGGTEKPLKPIMTKAVGKASNRGVGYSNWAIIE